jgi:trans-aconitate methyltransferase
MAERAAGLMRTGECPGEKILTEWETILPWFGPMLEHMFGPLLKNEVIDRVPVFSKVNAQGGVIVDLGCGNGWYLRAIISRYPKLRGIGLDGFKENIDQADRAAEREGLTDRLTFAVGDIYNFHVDEPVNLIAMNRSLHHVWDQKKKIFAVLRDHLCPGGSVVIWEPDWPLKHEDLQMANRRALAFQNLSEHVLGNHFLHADEIVAELKSVGLKPEVFSVADGRDVVVTGTRGV